MIINSESLYSGSYLIIINKSICLTHERVKGARLLTIIFNCLMTLIIFLGMSVLDILK